MNKAQLCKVEQQVRELIEKSGLVLTDAERVQLAINDFGLGDIYKEGMAFVDILRSPRLRITVIVLLPNQTLPQHVHPPYEGEIGKEETLRVLYGHTRVFVEGDSNLQSSRPEGKEQYYTALQEIPLNAGGQFTVNPGIRHWFQAGPEGSVNLTFQNRVDETKNIFDDPDSQGCPIKLSD